MARYGECPAWAVRDKAEEHATLRLPLPPAPARARYGASPAWASGGASAPADQAAQTAAAPGPSGLAHHRLHLPWTDKEAQGMDTRALPRGRYGDNPAWAEVAAPPAAGGAKASGSGAQVAQAAHIPPDAVTRKRKAAAVFTLPASITAGEGYTAAASAASHAFLEARESIRITRDAKASIAHAGLDKTCIELTGAEVLAAVRSAAITASAGAPKKVGRLKAYEEFMRRKFPFLTPLPVQVEGVMVYCTEHVIVGGYKAKYLSDIVSELRTATRPLGLWGLSAEDEEHLLTVNKFLQRSFPCASAPQPTLSLEQLAKLYRYLDTLDCVEARLCSALIKMMVCMQARATELLDGALWAGDIAFHPFGVLINSVLNKCRKGTLDPMARVAPRLPEHMQLHDVFYSLQQYLYKDAGWADGMPVANTPVFRQPQLGADGKWALSDAPLSAVNGRQIILKYLSLAGVVHDPEIFAFTMHFGRAAGFNLLHNTLMLERTLCAAAGGWRHGDVIDKHYHVRSPLELAVNFRLAFLRLASLLPWKLL
jgi:hypothetical protein